MNDLLQAVASDLLSNELEADRRDGLAPFEPLIGSWDMRSWYQRSSGQRTELRGYVNFAWGFRGTALVDIFGFEGGVVGSTIRFYDAERDRIRSTWICPSRNALVPFTGRAVDQKIVLTATLADPPNRRLRWSFVSIEAQTFHWTGEVSEDGGDWLLVQEIEGKRRAGALSCASLELARDSR
jgi:hypothetical protein